MPSVLAYWDIRGFAQPIRLLLNYVGEDFEDKMYKVGPAPDYEKCDWFDVKFSLGLDFPNLPYYMDGDVKLSQSIAIMRYLGRKYNLCGTSEAEKQRMDLCLEQAMDLRKGWSRFCYNPDFDDMKEDYLKGLARALDFFEKYLGDRKWFAGENMTIADFVMYELLDQHMLMKPDMLNDCPKLKALVSRFEALPAIKKYMESPKFMKNPIHNRMAKFGAK